MLYNLFSRTKWVPIFITIAAVNHLTTSFATADEIDFTDEEISAFESTSAQSREPAMFKSKVAKVAAAGAAIAPLSGHLEARARVKTEAQGLFKEWKANPKTRIECLGSDGACGGVWLTPAHLTDKGLHDKAIQVGWKMEYERREKAAREAVSQSKKAADEKFKKNNSDLYK